MSETPRYVLEAVRAFIEEDRREPILQLFGNGIPLYSYPESRDLIEKVMRGDSLRKRGQKVTNPHTQSRDISIQTEVAQLAGAGLGLISKGGESKATACSVVARRHGLTPEAVDKIYKKADRAVVKAAKAFGEKFSGQLLELYKITG